MRVNCSMKYLQTEGAVPFSSTFDTKFFEIYVVVFWGVDVRQCNVRNDDPDLSFHFRTLKKNVASVTHGHGKNRCIFMLRGTEARAMIFHRLKLEKRASSRSAPPTTSIHIDSTFVHLQTLRNFLGAPGAAVVQESGAEGCGEKTRTAC